jgi:phosphatidate cytidylyltransferase
MALGNTSTRVIVSIIAIPLIIGGSLVGGIPFLIFTLGIALISFWEFSEMIKKKEAYPNFVLGSLVIVSIILNVYFKFLEFYVLFLFASIIILISELFRNKASAIINVAVTFLGILYLGLFSSSILLIREIFSESELLYSEGGYLIISIMIAIWICDSAAFFIGSAFGKHKLFPRVSPNKSWEGAIAGFVFAIVSMISAKAIFLDILTLTDSIIIGTIVGTVGQIGDLVESLVKRDAGVKDSSAIIPGHGGIFDRFDSLLFTAPVVYIYLHFTVVF